MARRPTGASGYQRWMRSGGRLLVELVVVFIGVYAAFLLDRYQEGQRADERRTAIYQALLSETDRTEDFARWYVAYVDSNYVEPMVRPYERGEQPAIYGLWLPTAHQSGTWEAMLEAGVDLLDPGFIQAVEGHRSTVQFMNRPVRAGRPAKR